MERASPRRSIVDRGDRAFEMLECLVDAGEQPRTFRRQDQALGRALEQLEVEFLLQLTDLQADGGGGDEQFLRRSGKAFVARRGPESPQRIQ